MFTTSSGLRVQPGTAKVTRKDARSRPKRRRWLRPELSSKAAERILSCLLVLATLAVLLSLPESPISLAQGNSAYIREVRVLETNQIGLLNPAGLAYSPRAREFIALKDSPPTPADLIVMTPFEVLVC